MKKKCERCGKEFETKSYNTKKCELCKNINTCTICGREFETIASERRGGRAGKAKCCSKECSKQLRKQTNIRKYGTETPAENDKILEKIKKTNREKYGVDNVFQSKEVLEKLNSKRSETIQKQQNTMVERYGYKSSFERVDVQDKVKETFKEKYGTNNPFGNKKIQEKIKETNMKRYGVPYTCVFNLIRTVSKANLDFQEFLKGNGIESELEFVINNMSYDLHVLNTNILIEINPTYTHNSTRSYRIGKKVKEPKSKDYHFNKTKNAIDNGFQIINVFEWDKIDEILNMIKENNSPKYKLKIRKNFYNKKTKDRIIDLNEELDDQELIDKDYVIIYDVI